MSWLLDPAIDLDIPSIIPESLKSPRKGIAMRTRSAASVKFSSPIKVQASRLLPKEGSRLREVHDLLIANFQKPVPAPDRRDLTRLRDDYEFTISRYYDENTHRIDHSRIVLIGYWDGANRVGVAHEERTHLSRAQFVAAHLAERNGNC